MTCNIKSKHPSVILFWKWETNPDKIVQSEWINSRINIIIISSYQTENSVWRGPKFSEGVLAFTFGFPLLASGIVVGSFRGPCESFENSVAFTSSFLCLTAGTVLWLCSCPTACRNLGTYLGLQWIFYLQYIYCL